MGLDERLYEFAHRLSDEQLRSVVWDEETNRDRNRCRNPTPPTPTPNPTPTQVWDEENASDVCAAADVASSGLARRGLPLPLRLDEQASYATRST